MYSPTSCSTTHFSIIRKGSIKSKIRPSSIPILLCADAHITDMHIKFDFDSASFVANLIRLLGTVKLNHHGCFN
jgi:hypothetical protein